MAFYFHPFMAIIVIGDLEDGQICDATSLNALKPKGLWFIKPIFNDSFFLKRFKIESIFLFPIRLKKIFIACPITVNV